MSSTPEGLIKTSITKYLKNLEDQKLLTFEVRQAQGGSYKKGRADIWVVLKGGLHIEIEVKAPGGSLSTMQEKWIARCEARCIPCVVVDCVEDVKSVIDNLI